MRDDLRKYLEFAAEMLSPGRAREILQSLGGPSSGGASQPDLAEAARKVRERVTDVVQSEIRRQVASMGFATQDDVERLKIRVGRLEDEAAASDSGKGSGKGSTAPVKVSGAKRTSSRRTPSGKPASTSKTGTSKRAGSVKSSASSKASGGKRTSRSSKPSS